MKPHSVPQKLVKFTITRKMIRMGQAAIPNQCVLAEAYYSRFPWDKVGIYVGAVATTWNPVNQDPPLETTHTKRMMEIVRLQDTKQKSKIKPGTIMMPVPVPLLQYLDAPPL